MKIPVWLDRLPPQGSGSGSLLKLTGDGDSTADFPFQRGEVLTGRAIAALRQDVWLVNVAGRSLAMSLPDKPASGTTLRLVVLESGPRPVLLLSRPVEAGDSAVQLSPDAHFLSQLRQQAAPGNAGPGSAQIRSSQPLLLDSGRLAAPLLGNALQQALTESGLFYESHLAGWVSGKFPLEQLLTEPQGRLSTRTPQPLPDQHRFAASPEPPVPASVSVMPKKMGAPAPEARFVEQVRQAYQPDLQSERPLAHSLADKGGRMLTDLMQQQLNLIDSAHLQWSGPVWPGQEMQWDLYREPGEDSSDQPEAGEQAVWYSTLRLQLPRLGEICIQIRLQQQKVSVQLQADPSVHSLFGRQDGLRCALEAAELSLTSLKIDAHESTP